jgi:hypothetical protein
MFWEMEHWKFASATRQRSCSLCFLCVEISGHERYVSRPQPPVLAKRGAT